MGDTAAVHVQGVLGGNCHLLGAPSNTYYSEPSPDWEFDMKGSRHARLKEVAPTEKAGLLWEYDFGDSWLHEILVEEILPPVAEKSYPVGIAGERACPPEYVGGAWGYEEFLEALRSPVPEDTRAYWRG